MPVNCLGFEEIGTFHWDLILQHSEAGAKASTEVSLLIIVSNFIVRPYRVVVIVVTNSATSKTIVAL